ncbi:MAG: DUF5329 family protein [Proteobacteria bacterium]|nr:DUF5329 family protein [Pseudomonadota bacterium]
MKRPVHLAGWLLIAALSLGVCAYAADASALERQKIDYLIGSVEGLQGAEFFRNGKSYDAQEAGKHLRLKLRLAGSRIATADDFIRLCGSVSSMSGLPYQIRFSDGHTVSSEAYLRQKLAEFDRVGSGASNSRPRLATSTRAQGG